MADPSTFIPFVQVYTLPTDGEKSYLERFYPIKMPILRPSYPYGLRPSSRSRLEFLRTKAAENHLIYDLPEGIQNGPHDGVYKGRFQPDIHLLPNTVRHWDINGFQGWGRRAAIHLKGYHLFYLREKDARLPLNKHAGYRVPGKMFLLQLSDARDKTGHRFYVDFDCGAEDLDDLIKSLGDQEYFGPQKWEKDLLAAKMSLEGPESHLQYIHTVTKDFLPSHLLAEDEFDTYVHYLRNEDAELPLELGHLLSKVKRVALPDTRPYYPEHLSAQDLKRTRAMIGNSKFHAFLERAEEVKEGMPSNREFTVLKVSGDVDRNGRWFYEDVDSDPRQLMNELSHNIKQLISIFKFR